MVDRTLLSEAKKFAASLKSASLWPQSDVFFRLVNSGIFELYVLTRLVEALLPHYKVTFVRGNGRFPRAPASKAGKPRFELDGSDGKWQLCMGTRIEDTDGNERAPDISLQVGAAGDSPTAADVLIIWDAKYKTNRSDRLSDHEVESFACWVEAFQIGPPKASLNLGRLGGINGNTLVTNGDFSTETQGFLNRKSVRECKSFYPARSHQARP